MKFAVVGCSRKDPETVGSQDFPDPGSQWHGSLYTIHSIYIIYIYISTYITYYNIYVILYIYDCIRDF